MNALKMEQFEVRRAHAALHSVYQSDPQLFEIILRDYPHYVAGYSAEAIRHGVPPLPLLHAGSASSRQGSNTVSKSIYIGPPAMGQPIGGLTHSPGSVDPARCAYVLEKFPTHLRQDLKDLARAVRRKSRSSIWLVGAASTIWKYPRAKPRPHRSSVHRFGRVWARRHYTLRCEVHDRYTTRAKRPHPLPGKRGGAALGARLASEAFSAWVCCGPCRPGEDQCGGAPVTWKK